MNNFLIVAGDPSGDVHAAHLARSIKTLAPGAHITAVGGAHLKEAADDFIYDLASLGVTGFWEPVRRLPIFWKLLKLLKGWMVKNRPEAVICVDFYGFNRWVLEAAKAQGIKTVYYISPQVWASRPRRAQVLKRLVDQLLVIFPFEVEFYRKAGVHAQFVGHPLLDMLPAATSENSTPRSMLEIGFLPGSRPSEISRHLRVFLQVWKKLKSEFPQARARLFAAAQIPDETYRDATESKIELIRETDYRQRAVLDIAITSSGTATLENALLGIPMVVVYRLSWPTYAIARGLVSVPFISMANILAGKKVVPELIQHDATSEKIFEEAARLLRDPSRRNEIREEFLALRGKLGSSGASLRAAGEIVRPSLAAAERG